MIPLACLGIISSVETAPPTTFVTDNFDGAVIPDIWTFYMPPPNNDGSFAVVSNQLVIDCPQAPQGGANGHDLWTSGIQAPHLVQQNANTDFDVNTKLESLPALKFQMIGFVVKTSLTEFIRIGYFSPADSSITLFIASFDAAGDDDVRYDVSVTGVVNIGVRLRVRRVGNVFTVFKWDAVEGDSDWVEVVEFTNVMVVNEVGLHSGNLGTTAVAPQFDSKYEYFADQDDPPS